MLSIHGKLSMPDGKDPIIMPDKVTFWNTEETSSEPEPEVVVEEKKEAPKTLYLKFDTTNTMINEKIVKVLKNYIGPNPVVVKCEKTGKAFKYSFKVNVNNYLLNEINGIINEDCIKFI